MRNKKYFSYFSTKTYVVGTQKNRLNETVLLSTQNICSNWWIRKYLQFYAQKICLSKPMIWGKNLGLLLYAQAMTSMDSKIVLKGLYCIRINYLWIQHKYLESIYRFKKLYSWVDTWFEIEVWLYSVVSRFDSVYLCWIIKPGTGKVSIGNKLFYLKKLFSVAPELSLTDNLQFWTPIFGAGTAIFWSRLYSFVLWDSHFLAKRALGLLFSKS